MGISASRLFSQCLNLNAQVADIDTFFSVCSGLLGGYLAAQFTLAHPTTPNQPGVRALLLAYPTLDFKRSFLTHGPPSTYKAFGMRMGTEVRYIEQEGAVHGFDLETSVEKDVWLEEGLEWLQVTWLDRESMSQS